MAEEQDLARQDVPDGPEAPESAEREAEHADDGNDAVRTARREAAGYRTRLREAEAERDRLREQVTAFQRRDAEALAGKQREGWLSLRSGADLWAAAYAAIVNTCSVAATIGIPNRALYSASKGAVLSLTLAMAADHVGDGIRVNGVSPGTADTPWVARLLGAADDPEAAAAALRDRQPMGRLVTAEEVAHAIAYLASPLSASTTGTVLGVDGGMETLRLPR